MLIQLLNLYSNADHMHCQTYIIKILNPFNIYKMNEIINIFTTFTIFYDRTKHPNLHNDTTTAAFRSFFIGLVICKKDLFLGSNHLFVPCLKLHRMSQITKQITVR